MEIAVAGPDCEDIIRSYAEKVPFPNYWQFNWNSFDECLRDSLARGMRLTAVHSFTAESLGENSLYLDIIRDVSNDFDTFSYEFRR
jgi:hypothetical protein